jgi:uncharacterized membrane protein YdfJ with MMPL/SSD domain
MVLSSRNLEAELLDGVLDVLSNDLSCRANIYEIREAIARMKMADEEGKQAIDALIESQGNILARLTKLEKQVESIVTVVNIVVLGLAIYLLWPYAENLIRPKHPTIEGEAQTKES